MTKKQQRKMTIIFGVIGVLLVAGIVMTAGSYTQEEDVVTVIRDSVIHDTNKIDLFGLEVNPGLIAGFAVTGILTVFALIVRIFVIPRFTLVPGKFQMVLEWLVGYFSGLSETNSPRKNRLLGAYVFAAGFYIFAGTMFELFGIQAVTTSGHSVALPAPLSDVNGAIMMGCTSYLFIVLGGILNNGVGGLGGALKEFSLPISMSSPACTRSSRLTCSRCWWPCSTARSLSPRRKNSVNFLPKRKKPSHRLHRFRRKIKMNKTLRFVSILALAVVFVVLAMSFMSATSFAFADTDADVAETTAAGAKGLPAAIAIGIAAFGGALAMGLTASKSAEAISRQPEADGKIRSVFMLGLVFIETVVIYALLIAILIIFVL